MFGAAEDLGDEQVQRVIVPNLTASIQLVRRTLPHLRAQGGCLFVQMSSQGALFGFPICHATKWGIEGCFEALAQEVAPLGIKTMLVEPGMV